MIIVAGESLIDLLLQPDGRLSASLGGGPFNTARTIGRLGGSVAYLGCLARDRFGRQLRAALHDDGVDLSLVTTTDLPTTLAIAELDDDGAAVYRFHTAETAAPSLDDAAVSVAIDRGPAALHVGTLGLVLEPMASVLAAGVERVGESTLVMLDANCRASAIRDRTGYLARLSRVAARADVIKVSVDDLGYVAPGAAPMDAVQALAGRSHGVVLLTDGGRPVVAVTRTETIEVPVPNVDVVDTVGAGDAFGGAFLTRWIELGRGRRDLDDGEAVRAAVALAIQVANLTCQRPGADPPRRAELTWPEA